MSQSSMNALEEDILKHAKFRILLRDYLTSPETPFQFQALTYRRKYKCFIIKKESYVSTFIERNWARHIEISYEFRKVRHAAVTYAMIVYQTNTCTMNMTSKTVILYSSSDEVEINIKPDCDYTFKIVYLSIQASEDGFLVYVHHKSQSHVPCTHVKPDVPIFRVSELRQLERKCRSFTQYNSSVMRHVHYLYRNKPSAYFDKIKQNGGDMVPYIKDMSGDPRCPINGRIDGLFFMTNLDRYSSSHPTCLPPVSPFGDKRLIVWARSLFNSYTNLYFSDFFCMKDHYVSLVLTKPGSVADLFCQHYLLPLDKRNNPYLQLDTRGSVFSLHLPGLWVEVMYTETVELNMHGAHFTTVRTLGRGQSTRMGIPKKASCPHCNL